MTARRPLNSNHPVASKHIANLPGLRVTICCEPDATQSSWIRSLQRERLDVTSIWPPPASRLDPDMDILICEYFPQMADFIPWIPGDAKAALIVVLPQNGHYKDGPLLAAAAQAVLQKPFSDDLLKTTVKVAWSQFRYERRLMDRVSKLDENVKSLRDVERAKLIIMTEKNIDEDAAYRHLRETAMKRQIAVSTLAKKIVQELPQNNNGPDDDAMLLRNTL